MKKIVYYLFQKSSLLLLNISLLINSHKLCAFVVLINIRKIKSIRSKTKNKKKILVFPKSGGNEDLLAAYHNQKNINISYFLLERIFLKTIFHHHFKNTDKSKFNADLFIAMFILMAVLIVSVCFGDLANKCRKILCDRHLPNA